MTGLYTTITLVNYSCMIVVHILLCLQVTSSNVSTSPATPDQPDDKFIPIQQGESPSDQGDQATDDYTIARWLNSLGLSAYVDNFHQQGLSSLFQLSEFTLEVRIHPQTV